MKFIDKLVADATLIEYAEMLPPREAIMLLDGERYQTGSDYPQNILETQIGILHDAHQALLPKCEPCNGTGWVWYEWMEEPDRDICVTCWGSGKEQ